MQPINQKHFQIFFLFGSFFFLSVFLKNMQRNCFPFGFLIIIWIIIWKHLCNPSTKTFFRFSFYLVHSFYLSVFLKNMQRNCFPFGFLIIIWIIIWKHFKQSLTNGFLEWGPSAPPLIKGLCNPSTKTFSDFLFIWFILFISLFF